MPYYYHPDTTSVYVDKRKSTELIIYELSGRANYNINVFLMLNNKLISISPSATIECCMICEGEKITNTCSRNTDGSVLVTLPPEFRIDGKNIFCEINVSGNDGKNYRYKAMNFRVAVAE